MNAITFYEVSFLRYLNFTELVLGPFVIFSLPKWRTKINYRLSYQIFGSQWLECLIMTCPILLLSYINWIFVILSFSLWLFAPIFIFSLIEYLIKTIYKLITLKEWTDFNELASYKEIYTNMENKEYLKSRKFFEILKYI